MTGFREKAIFIWNDFSIGDADKIVSLLLGAGFQAAHLHSTSVDNWKTVSRVKLANALKAAGILVYGSVAVYGEKPAHEGKKAAEIVEQYELAGMAFDIEKGAIETAENAPALTKTMFEAYKAGTARPAAACWWPFYRNWNKPHGPYHNKQVLKVALEYAVVGMPMAYWNWGDDAANAVLYLEECWEQWRELTDKPIVVAGRACVGDHGTARPDAVLAYEQRARELGTVGITWWLMEHAVQEDVVPGVWAALAATPKFNSTEEPGEIMDYTKYPMGLVTKTTNRVKEAFGFVVYDLGGNDDEDPNEQAAAIETDALGSGKAPIASWRFTTHWYGRNQKSATPAAWPSVATDEPFQAFVSAVKNRSMYAVIINITDGTNHEGKAEDPFYLSFAAEQFVTRAETWLGANKKNCKLLVGSSNAFIEKSSPRAGDMNSWVGKYPSYIIQNGVIPLPASYPQGTDKPWHLDNRKTWEFWQYASNLAIFNEASAGKTLNAWLNYTPGTTPPPQDTTPPAVPAGLSAQTAGLAVSLSWSAVPDAAGYKVYRNGVQIAQPAQVVYVDSVSAAGTYAYQVSAYDTAGNESAKSAQVAVIVSVTQPPADNQVLELLNQLLARQEAMAAEQQVQGEVLAEVRAKFS